ncbi:MAG: methionyl-tRNA formyltransferase [Patescibacteria group bacterium]
MAKVHPIIFLGTSAFAVPSLRALAGDPSFKIDLVITQPDRPAGRGKKMTPSPIKMLAKDLGLPIAQPESINEWRQPATSNQQPATFRPDFLVVVSYGQILPLAILNAPVIAPVNVHASLLPRWRGASPIQHAILAGDKETGVTVQRMVKELDAGPILAQEKTAIDGRTTAPHLHDRLATMGADLLTRTLNAPLSPVEQDEINITFCKKLTREDGKADPASMAAEEIDRRVRALNPWPGVTADVNGQTFKILAAELTATKDSFPLPCAKDTVLHLVSVQMPGGKPISGAEWARRKVRG